MLALIASVANVHCNCSTIVDKSEITTHPSNVTKTEGENVTLQCMLLDIRSLHCHGPKMGLT